MWREIRSVHPGWLALTVLLATATFPLRAIRWRYLLRFEGEALGFAPLWHATAIGFMANNLLPARAGEVARAYTVQRLTSVRFTTAVASLAVERVMDGIVLVLLLSVATTLGGFSAGTTVGGITIGGIVRGASILFGVLLGCALVVVHSPQFTVRLVRRTAGRVLPARWTQRLIGIIEGLVEGLDALRRPVHFLIITWWSLIVWLTAAASFWAAFRAFNIDIPWSASLLTQGLVSFGVAIPSSPGFVGPFEAAVRVSLGLYGVRPGLAVSLAVGYHLTTFLPITLLGMWSLTRAHVHLGDLRTAEARASDG
jgi:uncharacterized protein (TIRG00374 family)